MQLPMADLDALYERAPTVKCKGLCAAVCTGIGMSPGEWARASRRRPGAVGPPPRRSGDGAVVTIESRCRFLTPDNRCGVYEVRPMVCRLWGGTELMPCPHGCEVEGGPLPEPGGLVLLQEAMRAGGANAASGEDMRRLWEEDAGWRERTKAMMLRAQEQDRERMKGQDGEAAGD